MGFGDLRVAERNTRQRRSGIPLRTPAPPVFTPAQTYGSGSILTTLDRLAGNAAGVPSLPLRTPTVPSPTVPGPVGKINLTGQLADVKKQWNEASLRGDRAAMDALHTQANQLRARGADERTALTIAPPPQPPPPPVTPALPRQVESPRIPAPAVPSLYGGVVGAAREQASRAAGQPTQTPSPTPVQTTPTPALTPAPSQYGGVIGAILEAAQRAAGGAAAPPGSAPAPVYPLGPTTPPTPSMGELRRLEATPTPPAAAPATPAAMPASTTTTPPAAATPLAVPSQAAAVAPPVASPPPAPVPSPAVPPPAPTQEPQTTWQQQVETTNQTFANTVETVNQGYTDMINSVKGDNSLLVIVTNGLNDAFAQLNAMEQTLVKQFRDQMGAEDPAITAALSVIRDEVDLQRKQLLEELNAKGLAQSGILVEMRLRLNKNQLTAEQQIVANRLSDLTNQLNSAIMNFANTRVNLMSQGIGLRASAQESQMNRVMQASQAALGAQTQLAGMGLEQQRFGIGLGFQAGENAAQRQFTAGQNELQRGWQDSQTELQRAFESQQSALNRGAQASLAQQQLNWQKELEGLRGNNELAQLRERYKLEGEKVNQSAEQMGSQMTNLINAYSAQLSNRSITLNDVERDLAVRTDINPLIKKSVLDVLRSGGWRPGSSVPNIPAATGGYPWNLPGNVSRYMRNP